VSDLSGSQQPLQGGALQSALSHPGIQSISLLSFAGCRVTTAAHLLSWRRARHRCGSSASGVPRGAHTSWLQWQVPLLNRTWTLHTVVAGITAFIHTAGRYQCSWVVPLVAGFVNLTSLRLRARGSVQNDQDDTRVPWHAEWGRRMTYTLRCLQHLTAPADGGTRCAYRALYSTPMHGHQARAWRIGIAEYSWRCAPAIMM
jgi:hypothetical protein